LAMEVFFQDPALIQFVHTKGMERKFQPPWMPRFKGAHETLFPLTKWSLYAGLQEEK
jgi:hypothetical protein